MTSLALGSSIRRVVVHARGALVTRAVTLPAALSSEPCELVVPGITPLSEPSSFRALAKGDREVVSVGARFVVPEGPAKVGSARERLRVLEAERDALTDARTHLTGRRNLLAGLSFDLGMDRRLRQGNPRARIEDALATSRLAQEELAVIDTRLAELDASIERVQRGIDAARLAEAQASTDERTGASRPTLACHVRLGAGQGVIEALEIEYVVLAARWWPTYKAWLTKNATRVRLELDALVAQDSGEDWKDVELALSTADLVHDARLPELQSLRFGRAQPPAKRGYRPPPPGLDAMFESYDAAMAKMPRAARTDIPPPPPAARPAAPPPPPKPAATVAPQSLGAPPPAPGFGPSMDMPAPAAMPMPARSAPAPAKKAARKEEESVLYSLKSLVGPSGGGGPEGLLDELNAGASNEPAPLPPLEPDDSWLEFDALVLAPADDKQRRGRLGRVPDDASRREANSARERIDVLPNPARTQDPLVSRGRFDHRYDAEGRGDVPSNGRPHRVHIKVGEGPASPRFRAVPRESTEVYREARIENPLGAPLCAGPVDVFLEGALVTTAEIAAVDRGGYVQVGLGVEDRVRIARNARVEESSAGLLGGSTVVDHHVTVDLTSSLGVPIQIEILERIPVTDDKDVTVKLTSAEPEPEVYDQADIGAPVRGGRRFRVEVPASGKSKITYAYRIKLPAKSEIVGGNRRE
ncbi:DUF4139 domain-containing protein [Polyangium jinanense]|uniref:DUF4139 domain-containing protein n=1 Tax=Polyangium jinanense TaxID=2829994 RepID=A0A9X4ARJ6_9BACT|nr:DUF4139 domain-containing protein [Polyangium jinanense]MDC3952599.1 DUF4139 domain-containing protein [Polyangium jinanense]MDC3980227.1 DUF4139 domain-containing protein [Polyangium jinanense]